MRSHKMVFRYLLDEILIVIGWRAVTGQDVVPSVSRGGQFTEPMSVVWTEAGVSVSIRRSHTCRIGTGYPAIMVATDHETA